MKNTWYAARERLSEGQAAPYVYVRPSEEELAKQRARAAEGLRGGVYEGIAFSIVVPAYRTDRKHLTEMITSVIEQSYPEWELIIADATEDEGVREGVASLMERIEADYREAGQAMPGSVRYMRLPRNGGIAENTNYALECVSKAYVGLLDHDDFLAPDALYEMAECIRRGREAGSEPQMLYSDEDKCNADATEYYEPHFKEEFNLDLILSNNYICHFLALKRGLMQKLRLREAYEGAQDYDLVLRAVSELEVLRQPENEALICHVPKVLYHWRCHAGSTAENPRSKAYAYEAGRRALQDFADRNGLCAKAEHLKHLGFYRLQYMGEAQGLDGMQGLDRSSAKTPTMVERMLAARPDIGAVGGCLIRRGSVCGGRMDSAGNVLYQGLSAHASGYMHRAALTQDAEAVDIRLIAVRKELRDVFEKTLGIPYQTMNDRACFAAEKLPGDMDCTAASLQLCEAIRKKGYRIIYLPDWIYRDDTEQQ